MRFGIGLLRLAVARAPAFLSFVSCPPCGLCPCLLVSLPCFSPRLFSCHCRPVQVPTATSSSTRSGPLACLWLLLAATAAGVAAAVAVVCCWPGCFCWLLLLVAAAGCCCFWWLLLLLSSCRCCSCCLWLFLLLVSLLVLLLPLFGTLSLFLLLSFALFPSLLLALSLSLSCSLSLWLFVLSVLSSLFSPSLSVSVSILSDLDLYSLARPALSLLTAPDWSDRISLTQSMTRSMNAVWINEWDKQVRNGGMMAEYLIYLSWAMVWYILHIVQLQPHRQPQFFFEQPCRKQPRSHNLYGNRSKGPCKEF